MIAAAYRAQVDLLLQILPYVSKEKNFALKKNKMVDRSIKPKPKNTVKRFKRR